MLATCLKNFTSHIKLDFYPYNSHTKREVKHHNLDEKLNEWKSKICDSKISEFLISKSTETTKLSYNVIAFVHRLGVGVDGRRLVDAIVFS